VVLAAAVVAVFWGEMRGAEVVAFISISVTGFSGAAAAGVEEATELGGASSAVELENSCGI
jgi:hypothetical protein